MGNPTVASLFSGCGGFDIGFESEGFRPTAAFDIDPFVVSTYNANVNNVAKVCDLSSETPEIRADVLLAGSPCQGFSTAGKRKLDDPRNDLLIRAGEIAVRIRPRVFILENVPAAIAGQHGSRWEQVESTLKDAGYNVLRFVAEGSKSGIAQQRKRLFLISWLGSPVNEFSPPEVSPPKLVSVLKGVDGLSGHHPVELLTGTRERLIAEKIQQGQKLCNVRVSERSVPTWQIPSVFGDTTIAEVSVLSAIVRLRRRDRRRKFGDADPVIPTAINDFLSRECSSDVQSLLGKGYLRNIGEYVDLTHTYNGKYRRLALDGLSPTVDTHFGNASLFLHPKYHRGLTVREAARIQGFSDSFKLNDAHAKGMKMIGNAVPPPMAARIARFVRQVLV